MNKAESILAIAMKRGFFFPTAEYYGSKAGFWTYGHLGTLMKRKWENLWRDYFLNLSPNYFEIEGNSILSEDVFKSSGHLEHFKDVMPKEEQTKEKKTFSMMFDVKIGTTGKEIGYLSPETAQNAYLSFKREFFALREKLPFGLAIIGKAFRNEISPRQGFFRLREFTQAELQIFFDPDNIDDHPEFDRVAKYKLRVFLVEDRKNNRIEELSCEQLVKKLKLPKFYVYHLAVAQKFYLDILKLPKNKFRIEQIPDEEKAFYNQYHWDFQIDLESFGGWSEVGGCHYRTDHDLKGHQKGSGENLTVNVNGKSIICHILELSFGLDRNIYAIMELSYKEDKDRTYFSFQPNIAPYQVVVLPLVKKDGLPKKAIKVYEMLREEGINVGYDETYIGKAYYRQDEIGTVYCITFDYDSIKDSAVTIRFRDNKKQTRVRIKKLPEVLRKLFNGQINFEKAGKLVK